MVRRAAQRAEEERVREAQRAAEAARLRALQAERAEKYAIELSIWTSAVESAQTELASADEAAAALEAQARSRRAEAEAARAAASELRADSKQHEEALRSQVESLRARMGQQRFSIRDLENRRESRGGNLEETQASRLEHARARMQATQTEVVELEAEIAQVEEKGAAELALAAASDEEAETLEGELRSLRGVRDALTDELGRLRAAEPHKPEHMVGGEQQADEDTGPLVA